MEDRHLMSRRSGVGLLGRMFGLLVVVLAVSGALAASASAGQAQQQEFTIEKLQEIQGSGKSFTTGELEAKLGQTVDYEIVVKDTGSQNLKLSEFADAHCDSGTIAGGPGSKELKPGESSTYTCRHVLSETGTWSNTASVTGTAQVMCGQGFSSMRSSNTVVVKVIAEPAATIEKLQEIKGSGKGFTKSELTGQVGQTVDYEVIVHNTGQMGLKLSAFSDPNCENIHGGPSGELVPGASTTYTCEHVLTTPGEWTNTATVTATSCGCSGPVTIKLTSNTVVVNTPAPSFEVIKKQRLKGESSYTTSKLVSTTIPNTVEYEIFVKNTTSGPLKVEALSDTNCNSPSGPLKAELQAGEEALEFTCAGRALPTAGTYANVASVEAGKSSKKSNEVVAELKAATFRVIKKQRFKGESSYTTSPITSTTVPNTVEYEILVENTGEMPIKVEGLKDTACSGANASPEHETVQPGETLPEYRCTHELTKAGEVWRNVASVKGSGKEEPSNEVVAELKGKKWIVIKKQRLAGESSYTTSKLVARSLPPVTVEYEILVKNSGETPIEVERLRDSACEGANATPEHETVQPGEELTEYRCSRVLSAPGSYKNVAIVGAGEEEHPSNEVETEVPPSHFRVIKEQRLAGESSYTTSPLVSHVVPATVEYEILVENTGEVALKVEGLKDTACSGANSAPEHEVVQPGETLPEYRCSHELTKGGEVWTNVASVKGNGEENTSNTVEVEAKLPSWSVIKRQRLAGESSYTTSKLVAHSLPPATVEYEILVKNTGEVPVKVEALKDTACEGANSAPEHETVQPGEELVEYKCSRTLPAPGAYTNVAIVQGNEEEHPSNEVETELPSAKFKVIKQQRFKGEAGYTTATLTATTVPVTVEYEILVENTGEVALKVEGLKDTACSGANSAPEHEVVQPGETLSEYRCSHELTNGGETYKNVASVKGSGKEEPSNEVVASTPTPKQLVKPECLISTKTFELHDVSGPKRRTFTVWFPAAGIKRITFYLDGHKLRTLSASAARNGRFSVTINPGMLSYGPHHVAVRTAMKDAACAPIARAASFVRPKAHTVAPKFTG